MNNRSDDNPALTALRVILRPLARLMLARGVTLPAMVQVLKETLVDVACEVGGRPGAMPSQSQISVATGVHRKDVRDILAAGPAGTTRKGSSLSETVVGRWLADVSEGAPADLPRRSDGDAPSFERLVASISTDVRPGTVLDELQRLDIVSVADDRVTLRSDAFLPDPDSSAALEFLAANTGDHLAAAVSNVTGQASPPFLERAVYYDGLSENSVATLTTDAQHTGLDMLARLNGAARLLQDRDLEDGAGGQRIRIGIYIYSAPEKGSGEATGDRE